jgi:hypothetical protein
MLHLSMIIEGSITITLVLDIIALFSTYKTLITNPF